MPPNPCRDFFARNAENSEVVKELQNQHADLVAWEKLSASDHSIGPVEQTEVIYRQILHTVHIDAETKTLKPPAVDDRPAKRF